MNTSVQHPINSPNLGKEVDFLSPQNSQVQSIQGLIGNIYGKVGIVIEQMKAKRQEFLKASQYFELAGYYLERKNHGAPKCLDIIINNKKASNTIPQAWSREIDGQIEWYYNYPGALAEAQFLEQEIPTIDQWMEMLATIPGSIKDIMNVLNSPMTGCRDATNNIFLSFSSYVDFWSCSPKDDDYVDYVYYVILGSRNVLPEKGHGDHGHGFSLRLMWSNK